jgi:hypothetical protein
MRTHLKRGLIAATLVVLPLTAACSATDDASKSAQKPASSTQGEAPATATSTPAGSAPAGSTPAQGQHVVADVTEQNVADFRKVVACARANGVNLADPVVGKPFDNKAMNDIAMTPPWNNVMSKCPDYTKVVIGVG